MSWLRSTELRGARSPSRWSCSGRAALAQDAQDTPAKGAPADGMSGGCESFKWPLDKERAAFDDAGLEKAASGAARGPLKEQAFALALVPAKDVAYRRSSGEEEGRRLCRAAGRLRRAGEAGRLSGDAVGRRLDRPGAERRRAPIRRSLGRQELPGPAQERALRGRRRAGRACRSAARRPRRSRWRSGRSSDRPSKLFAAFLGRIDVGRSLRRRRARTRLRLLLALLEVGAQLRLQPQRAGVGRSLLAPILAPSHVLLEE